MTENAVNRKGISFFLRSSLGTAVLALACAAVSWPWLAEAAGWWTPATPRDELLRHVRLAPEGLEGRNCYTLLTYALYQPTGVEFLFRLLGLTVFGLIVERRIGFGRMLLLFLCAVLGGAAVCWLFNSTTGAGWYQDVAAEIYDVFSQRLSERQALSLWLALEWLPEKMTCAGPVSGAAAGVAGLMLCAVVNRPKGAISPSPAVAFLFVLLACAYIGGELALTAGAGAAPFPAALYLGGVVAGLMYCFPDRFLKPVLKDLSEKTADAVARTIARRVVGERQGASRHG